MPASRNARGAAAQRSRSRVLAKIRQDRALLASVRALRGAAARRTEIVAAVAPVAQAVAEVAADGYATLAEARAAAARAEGRGAGLAIGLGVVAVAGVGLVLAYLLFRRREEPPQPQIVIVPAGSGAQLPAAVPAPLAGYLSDSEVSYDEAYGAGSRPRPDARVRSIPLPALTAAGSPARLATGRDGALHVTVRVFGQAGAFAVLAFSVGDLAAAWPGTVPTGDTLIVEAGDRQRFRLAPGQALFARGSVAGVVASVVQDALG